ncbi:MAG: EAL domain-containing protein [Candidatus Methylopumilus sp.]|jgi:diguanylate cyclase (GGDEF)-like protein/PAS domain S-box-containing protein
MTFQVPAIVDFVKEKKYQERLLIIDDDFNLAESLRELTELVGYHVQVRNSGPSGIRLLETETFDLVLLDLVMPGMSGHEVMDYLLARYPKMPIIVVTATGTINEAVRALRKGIYDFVRKPYQPEELLRTIENALHKSHLERLHVSTSNKLQHSENLYHYLVDSSPDIIYTLDNEGKFTFANKRVTTLLGFSVDELVGQHYSILVHEEDLDHAKYAFNERRTGERSSRNIELRLKCRSDDEEFRYFDTSFITIVLNSMGYYKKDAQESVPFAGTYGVARDISDRKKAEEAMTYQAYHDTLTGLPNRALFNDRLSVSMAHANRNQHQLGILFLDLDRFKWVNDTLGHVYGDELLKNVAARLKDCLRQGDTLARIGGDEFTVILSEIVDSDHVSLIAKKILEALEAPFILDNREISISASIGISIFPEHGEDIDTLTKSADIAMYHVKWDGKNGYRHYDLSMNSVFQRKLSLENELRKAIENNQLNLYFQPQVHLDSRCIVGLEALARWHHPERGWISPAEFIPLAEETGLIGMLTEWLIGQICMHYSHWKEAGFGDIRIALNISPESVLKNDFVQMLLGPLQRNHINADVIEIEITESFLMRNLESSISKLKELSSHGMKIAIDDFGTGYSSLAYLQKLPIHSIKIDKSFVSDIQSLEQELPIISAIAAIAKGFRLNVVAEGVETVEQMQAIQSIGCIVMQGFLFSRPIPGGEVLELLSNPERMFNDLILNRCLQLRSEGENIT